MQHYTLTKKIGKTKENINFSIPSGWQELTFAKFYKVFEVIAENRNEDIDLVCALSGLDKDFWKYEATAETYYTILADVRSWCLEIPTITNIKLPETVKIGNEQIYVPMDLGVKEVEIFEYCRTQLMKYQSMGEDANILDLLNLMKKIFTHYFFSQKHKYNTFAANTNKEFNALIDECSWMDVCAFGSFFLRKLKELTNGIQANSKRPNTLLTKLKQGIRTFLKSGASFWYSKSWRGSIRK